MLILVKGDDVRSGKKATLVKAWYGLHGRPQNGASEIIHNSDQNHISSYEALPQLTKVFLILIQRR